MTYRQLLLQGRDMLSEAGIAEAEADSRALLLFASSLDTHKLLLQLDQPASADCRSVFNEAVARRAKREPLQYIVGYTEFMSLRFNVSPPVLIPRQDTELLAETAIEFANRIGKCHVLEIGAGSGAVALSVAYYASSAIVDAIDISAEAITVAEQNRKLIGGTTAERVSFIHADIFTYTPPHKYTLVISNPPYIPTKDIATLQPEVSLYEPKLALEGGADGLDFYRRIIAVAPNMLLPNGCVMLEIGYTQAEQVCDIGAEVGFNTRVLRDLVGNERVVVLTQK